MAETTRKTYFYGTGRRKSAVAQVRIVPSGSGKLLINEKQVEGNDHIFLSPLKLVGRFGNTDLSVHVNGGGFMGQVGAIQLGIARALVELDEELRTTLKKAGLLTRDPRERERKKPGFKSARRSPQWSKR